MSNMWFTGPIKSFNSLEWTLSKILGRSQFGAVTVMIVTSHHWRRYVGDFICDRFKILVTKSWCWRHFSLCWWFFQSVTNVCDFTNTFRHQHRCNRSVVMETKSTDTHWWNFEIFDLVRSVQNSCWWPTFEIEKVANRIILSPKS